MKRITTRLWVANNKFSHASDVLVLLGNASKQSTCLHSGGYLLSDYMRDNEIYKSKKHMKDRSKNPFYLCFLSDILLVCFVTNICFIPCSFFGCFHSE